MNQKFKEIYDNVFPGWWELLDKYLHQVWAIDPDCEIVVKEKFGSLRVHPYNFKDGLSWKDFQAIYDGAEKESAAVCEFCGEPGYLRTDRDWWHTLCDRCCALPEAERNVAIVRTKLRYFHGSHAQHGEPKNREEVKEKRLKNFWE